MKLDADVVVKQADELRKSYDTFIMNSGSYLDRIKIKEILEKTFKTLGKPLLSDHTIETLNYEMDRGYLDATYRFQNTYLALIDKTNIYERINFVNNFTEKEFDIGKKIYDYFVKVGISCLSYRQDEFESFKKYYEANKTFDENNIIMSSHYSTVMTSDLVKRFVNAFSKDSKYSPGQFVMIRLGKMPGRIVQALPEHARNYVMNNPKADLKSAGIVLDVADDRIVRVKDRGRWYKVAVSTPFSIFYVEERHVQDYRPTKEYVKDLLESSKQADAE